MIMNLNMAPTVPKNHFKDAILKNKLQIGLFSLLSHHVSAEILAGCGFDWLILDTEHAPSDVLLVLQQLQAMSGGTAHAVVRPSHNDVVLIKRLLDIGVQTLMVPHVQNAAEARQAVASMWYPPRGIRGLGPVSRAANYGRILNYHEHAEKELCLIVQIENQEGLDNIEEIAAVEGVDAIFIGPGDLSAELGYIGRATHPDMRRVFKDAIARITACGKPAGIVAGDEALAREYVGAGVTVLASGADALLLARAGEDVAQRFKRLNATAPQLAERVTS
ncbi:MAG: 5-keto-4-deoxy-D-glucarate aldolase [Rhodocyclales bacterium]|nr:5-keto-4-deoxy-D-glucarate aldolase [Rhodocyclales bacterium]